MKRPFILGIILATVGFCTLASARSVQEIKSDMERTCRDRSDAVCATGFVLEAIGTIGGSSGGENSKCLEVGGRIVNGRCFVISPSDKTCTDYCQELDLIHFYVSEELCREYAQYIGRHNMYTTIYSRRGCAMSQQSGLYFSTSGNRTHEDHVGICACR